MVELIICNNDGMAEGAISALQNVGYNNGEGTTIIPVFGVDATDSAKALIKAGNMTGSIKQDAVGMATTINTLVKNVQDGVAAFKASGADMIVAVGGGSAMDTAKGIGIIAENPEFADVVSLEGVAPTKNHATFTIAVPTTRARRPRSPSTT